MADIYKIDERGSAPANGFAREEATASPGIKVLSSTSTPNKSKSRLAPNTHLLSKDDTSS